MDSGTSFHPFPRLPYELQLMVWECYRDLRPRRRHIFTYYRSGCMYAAVDVRTNKTVTVTAELGDPDCIQPVHPHAGPGDRKICLPEGSYIHVPKQTLVISGDGETLHSTRLFADKNKYAWVNFTRDVFFCGSKQPVTIPPTLYHEGFSKALLGPWSLSSPALSNSSWIKRDHWLPEIQKLAVRHHHFITDSGGSFLQKHDQDTLAHMTSLRMIYIVVPHGKTCVAKDPRWRESMADVDWFVCADAHARMHAEMLGSCAWAVSPSSKQMEGVKRELGRLFKHRNRVVSIRVVIDQYGEDLAAGSIVPDGLESLTPP
ncbi:uncharacterized protein BCR38DRAFT_449792 [Pseudomassariella vexata]|uniref:2EXR domain-containing protein n=1 Tax=Pseudomassariella vexata TaxID=1141098 RepID=A0A1Y2DD11_9PEZI|nr:uncharacterized protein BCR38DRAFT_449792 [Pseudomassariella vexata]ORY57160.1 hypothetical protein BCR38DRAFT_449792 [Pseudomassariella vexata]